MTTSEMSALAVQTGSVNLEPRPDSTRSMSGAPPSSSSCFGEPIRLDLGATRDGEGGAEVACRLGDDEYFWAADRVRTRLAKAPVLWRSAAVWPFNTWDVTAANSAEDDSRPYVTPDGNELWITRWYQGTPALFRSRKVGGEWQEAELIVSRFAGEPTLDVHGNLYFVHHFYDNGVMLEADIYVAYRK